jgi:CRISPR type I-E-associated protein CasB/Cse2
MAKTQSSKNKKEDHNPFFVEAVFSESPLFLQWLQRLHNPDEHYAEGGKSWKPELRRAHNLGAVLTCRAFAALCDTMKSALGSKDAELLPEYMYKRLALIAGVVVHGKYQEGNTEFIGKTLKGKDKDHPALSEQRFGRLMSLDDENAFDEIFLEWKRVTTMFKDSISLPQLADTLYYWTDRSDGDKVRANLAFFYYGGNNTDEPPGGENKSAHDNDSAQGDNDDEANK